MGHQNQKEKMKGRKVLDAEAIETIVLRMSYQIEEQFFGFDKLAIIGIEGEGKILAEKLASHISNRKDFDLQFFTLHLPKHQNSLPTISFEPELKNLNGIPVLLVDDVLNSGRTLSYCLSPLLHFEIPSLKIAVLVERTYRKFPVSSSITGMALSTTIEQNVLAVLTGSKAEIGVYLN
jgi:pyrimidine operon attenuation protein/uracil phosphoribosyltransferase